MIKVFITGFPHCGTTILRKIIGNSSKVFDVIKEHTSISNNLLLNQCYNSHIVFKQPYYIKKLNSIIKPNYKYCDKRIFILRNPRFVFSSLNFRFKNTDYFFNNSIKQENHSFSLFEECCEMFNFYKNLNDKTTLAIKYEELFINNFENLKKIFNFIGLEFKEDFISNERIGFIHSSDPLVIENNPHLKLRTSQINSKFEYLDCDSKINLSKEQENYITKSNKVKLVYPFI